MALANIVKSSLGPVGLDKMLVDNIGDVTITNDGATILKQLEVEHPAAKVLVDLAQLQDEEVGDGTTSVVIIAAELLRRANELVRAKIHPTSIMAGYRLAVKEAVKFIKSHLTVSSDKLDREFVVNAAKTSMSSKITGGLHADFFAGMCADAVLAVKREGGAGEDGGKVKYPVSAINVIKCHGRSATESTLVNGFALPQTRAAQQMPKAVKTAKIAMIDFPLQRHRMQLGIQIVVTKAEEMEAIRQREADITKERIAKILASGANVIMTTKTIDDLCMKYLVEAGVIGVRRVKKMDLKRLATATGGQLVLNLADLEGGESFDPANLGTAEEVREERVGDGEMLFITGTKTSKCVSLVLRGANEFLLDEMDRAMHDALCVVQRVLESKALVAGGGAVEAALSIYLDAFATTLGTKEQLAIREFAEALLVIPKTLAVNAAQDATELVAKLCAFHHASQAGGPAGMSAAGGAGAAAGGAGAASAGAAASVPGMEDKADLRFMGLDLVNGKVVHNLKAGVVEPAMSKVKSLRFATEAAITILRIDDFIKITPPQQQGR